MSSTASPRRIPLQPWPQAARCLPGLWLCLGLALAGRRLGEAAWLESHGLGALTVSLLLGIGLGAWWPAARSPAAAPGIALARLRLLRLGIVLYGLRLTVHDIAHVGPAGLCLDAMVVSSTFGLACWLGPRCFGLDRETSMLIGAGSAVCGAAAVMAAEPVVRARQAQAAVAIAVVVLFGTLAVLLYPALYRAGLPSGWIGGGGAGFGLYAGATIHEVAQVVAVGRAIGPEAADVAVIAKMVRVMMLAPLLLVLSMALSRRSGAGSAGPAPAITVPWFALGFIAAVFVHSLQWLPPAALAAIQAADGLLLGMAMAALGLSTRWSTIRSAGLRPLALGTVLFVWLMAGGALMLRIAAALCGQA